MIPSAKIKWIAYLTLGWICHLVALASVWHTTWHLVGYSSLLKFGGVFLLFLLGWLLVSAILGSIGPSRHYNFLISPYRTFHRHKWIYHNSIGFLLIRIEADSICIIETNSLYINEEYDIYNSGNVRDTARQIREYLDRMNENRQHRIDEEKKRREKLNAFEKWDGYLDKQDSRDNKLGRILGRK